MLTDDPKSLAYYRKGQALLATQIRLLSTRAPLFEASSDKDTRNGFSRHAPEIFERMKTLSLGAGLHYFFDGWVHDSYAGFIGKFDGHGDGLMHQVSEGERYVRWRGLYCGSDEQLNALRRVEGDGQRMA